MKPNINVTYLYAGYPDYWQGDGRRWGKNAGCVFAYVNATTTNEELLRQWVEDTDDFQDDATTPLFDLIDNDDVEAAIIEQVFGGDRSLLPKLSEEARYYAETNNHVEPGEEQPTGPEGPLPHFCCQPDDELPVCILLLELEEDE